MVAFELTAEPGCSNIDWTNPQTQDILVKFFFSISEPESRKNIFGNELPFSSKCRSARVLVENPSHISKRSSSGSFSFVRIYLTLSLPSSKSTFSHPFIEKCIGEVV